MTNTILHKWKKEFGKEKSNDFLWDNILGKQTKKDFIIKAYLISEYIKEIEGKYIGVLLPALGSSNLIIIAIYLANKIPVMFNWTLSKEGFNHCIKTSKVDKIITSSNFYENIKNDNLESYKKNNNFIFIEDLLKNISNIKKIKALIKSFFLPVPNIKESEIATILFTSGSENLPKAVPLTHKNIIENIKGSLSVFNLSNKDILLGFLPPFHSFGFTINTIMPLITGLRVSYTPNPTDAKNILKIIKHSKITAITATPTFLSSILSIANKKDLETIKYVVVGAEKCSQNLFDNFKNLVPNGVILEGYGITECSPVISINPIKESKPGTVGKIINGLSCKIIDLDTKKEVKKGSQGMIYVKGASIFNGYLDKNIESPFDNLKFDNSVENGNYYKTGDLGFLDKDNYLTITGRLKRFVKIAGEMISLPEIENVLLEKYGKDNTNSLAIETKEENNEILFVLFSIIDLNLKDINGLLRKKGIPNLVKIKEIKKIKELPLLGTGKIDYKILKTII